MLKIPPGWKQTKIGEIAEIKSGTAFKLNEYSANGIKILKGDNISHGFVSWKTQNHLPMEYIDKHPDIIIGKGEIVLALNRPVTGGNLKIALTKESDTPSILYQRAGKFEFKSEEIHSIFMFHFFRKYIKSYVLRNAVGSDQPFISTVDLKKQKIVLPPFFEQKKIAKILSTWDKAIETLEALIEEKARRKKGLIQKLFNQVDESWEKTTLEHVVTFLDGKRKPIKSEDRAKRSGPYPYYGASGIIDWVDDYIFDEPLILLGEDGENIISRNLPLAFQTSGKIWVNNHAHVLKPKNEIVDITFLTNYLESISYSKYNTGTAQPKLNKAICQKIPVIIPPLSVQKNISKILTTTDEELELTNTLLTNLMTTKTGLMQQLLTGKTRVLKND